MADSDEDADSFVVLGKAIGTVLPDEPLKRPVSVNELPVKDNQGRVRFHGAFTGGFSAGYFNSVGSKEGWAPATFVSSRQSRNTKLVTAAEDFMDDEDFSEHGIAPRTIVTSDQFKSEERATKRKALAKSLLTTNSFLHNVDGSLLDFIVPEKISIGVKLLRKMGWKEGQGVGPRQRKHRKKESKSNNKKTYSCAIAPSDSDSEISDDNSLQHVEFAPKDMCPISFHAKDNLHGLGYSGINIKAALPSTHVSLFSEPSRYNSITGIKKNKRGIKGIAFGVGAMEEDDEDIYAADSLSKYDQSIGFADEDDNLHGWTAPGRNKSGTAPPATYVGKILEGFTLSSKPLTMRVVYPPPHIPKGYRPYHTFENLPSDIQQPSEALKPQNSSILNALSRSIIIGETKTTGSVFDLISKSSLKSLPKLDNSKISESSDEKTNCSNNNQSPTETPTTSSSHKEDPEKTENDSSIPAESSSQTNKALGMKPFKIQSSQALQMSTALQSDYQPFIQDPLKQERYNKYLLLLKHGKVDPYSHICDSSMTGWEHDIEKEEFSKAAKLFRPLAAAMASRFTNAKFEDNVDSVELPEDITAKKKDLSNAAEMKLYGKLTREIFDWHPDKLLCRRFNVPDPHPGSGIIGVPKTKHDKYSIFDFLAPPPPPVTDERNRFQQDDPIKSTDSTTKKTSDNTTDSAPEKPSIFSHLMTEKPAFTPSTPSTSDSTNKDSVVTSDPQLTVGEGERPPMDLFKAIFADSSSDSEEEEEEEKLGRKKEEDKEEEEKKKKKAEEVNENKDKTEDDKSKEKEVKLALQTETPLAHNPERKKENVESIKEKISPSHSSKDSDPMMIEEASVEVYGPALPPQFAALPSSSDKQWDPLDKKLLGLLKKSSSKKHKHKSKHTSKKSEKDKHRERKDKKQKKKKKKKKKRSSSRTYDTSSSSSSSAD